MTPEEVRAIVREELINMLKFLDWDSNPFEPSPYGLSDVVKTTCRRIEEGERWK